jgi:hypothetical protein
MSDGTYQMGFRRRLLGSAIGILLLLLAACDGKAESRLNLPQITAEVRLKVEARSQLESMVDKWISDAAQAIAPEAWRPLLEAVPELRKGCREMLSDFEPMAKVSRDFSVRVLHAEHVDEQRSAILTFRCTVHVPDVTAYDERPATLLLKKESSVLKLLPVGKDCRNCADLYQVGYTQGFAAIDGYLAELNVEHSTDNPCCDGGDSSSGSNLLLVAVPEGAIVLAFEKDTDDYNHDDEGGDTQTVCTSKISYERDGKGDLHAIDARTSCSENGKVAPPVKASRFEWNAEEKRFLERGARSSG